MGNIFTNQDPWAIFSESTEKAELLRLQFHMKWSLESGCLDKVDWTHVHGVVF